MSIPILYEWKCPDCGWWNQHNGIATGNNSVRHEMVSCECGKKFLLEMWIEAKTELYRLAPIVVREAATVERG